jgi:NADPH:quinone reductase-like Zn-dependent oxidoreductase
MLGTNPKDWKVPIFLQKPLNSGDDVAGIVEAVGARVSEFKPGDRVAGMHEIGTEHGSFAEFAITPASTTFHIPEHVAFEEVCQRKRLAFCQILSVNSSHEHAGRHDSNEWSRRSVWSL